MTRDEVLKMPAGFEIDQLIINKVMKPDMGLMSVYSFFPSRNIQHAFYVESKIFDDGLAVFYISNLIYIVNKEEKLRSVNDWLQYYCVAHATPHQRCRAALLAVMDIAQ